MSGGVTAILRMGKCVTRRLFHFIATLLRHHRPWRRNALNWVPLVTLKLVEKIKQRINLTRLAIGLHELQQLQRKMPNCQCNGWRHYVSLLASMFEILGLILVPEILYEESSQSGLEIDWSKTKLQAFDDTSSPPAKVSALCHDAVFF